MAGLPKFYKRYQGQYARSITAAVLGVIAVALCYFTFTMLVKHVPTGEVMNLQPESTGDTYALAEAWTDAKGVTHAVGTPMTADLRKRMDEAKVQWFDFRATYHVPNAVYVHYGVPSAMFVIFAFIIFRLLNSAKFADFLIATEGEMKKVSWSSKQELIGSTIVVIATVAILAGLIYLADFSWAFALQQIGVLPKPMG